MMQAMGRRMGQPGGGPFKDSLNNTRKYVASANPQNTLDWPNSTLLSGDIPAAVAELKQAPGGNLVIMGSGQAVWPGG
jgi:dihydrofolate reductase